MTVLRRVVPGVGRVHNTVAPFAAAWDEANAAELAGDGPLWVALGDSMSQGIGASAITGGWVGQLRDRMVDAGQARRLVNLSVTGALVVDVVEQQIPAMRALEVEPDLITVLIGANDMMRRNRRAAAVVAFRRLLDLLPSDRTVIATMPRGNAHALTINSMLREASARGFRLAEMRSDASFGALRASLADDFFHPNERGYAGIADAFAVALGLPPTHRRRPAAPM